MFTLISCLAAVYTTSMFVIVLDSVIQMARLHQPWFLFTPLGLMDLILLGAILYTVYYAATYQQHNVGPVVAVFVATGLTSTIAMLFTRSELRTYKQISVKQEPK